MDESADTSLWSVYRGWEGYQASLVKAVAPRTEAELAYRPRPDLRSVGELVRHIALGRLGWFARMGAPLSAELIAEVPEWTTDRDGNRHLVESSIGIDMDTLVHWLEATWRMIDATLTEWTVADLTKTYRHVYWGQAYDVSRQWTVWRILTHDVHHGGQLSMLLYEQGIEIFELGGLGGHLTEPAKAAG